MITCKACNVIVHPVVRGKMIVYTCSSCGLQVIRKVS